MVKTIKSKKINRRRYFKGSHKKQSRKKMYGGENEYQTQEILKPNDNQFENINNNINNKIQSQLNNNNNNVNSVENEAPTLSDNLARGKDIALQVGNILGASVVKSAEYGVEKLAEKIGVDPKANAVDELKKISSAVKSEEGQAALSELGEAGSMVVEKAIVPGLIKGADSVLSHSGELGEKGIEAGMNAFSATPLGPLLDVPRFIANVTEIAQTSTDLAADLLQTTEDTIEKTKESKGEFDKAYSKLKNVINNSINNSNKFVSNGLNNIEQRVNSYGKEFVTKRANPLVQSGGTLKTLQNQAKIVGGRIIESQLEFLTPYKTTRKHVLKRKRTTRRR